MKSLWNKYEELEYKNAGIWNEKNKSYYHINIEKDKLFGNNSKAECYKFIKKHFEEGSKTAVMDVFFRNDEENEKNF